MGFDVSTGNAYAVLYSVLMFFTLLAFAAAGWLYFLPSAATAFCTLKGNKDGKVNLTIDYFLAARNAAGPWAIAFSYFAGGMGAWVLYGTTEMGATPQLSWVAVLGYSFGSCFPAILICWLGPKIRSLSTNAFSTTDFGRKRYGRVMQFAISCMSGFYMFIFIVAELTAISSVFAVVTNDFSKKYNISITLSVGFFTTFYTGIAGLPASIVSDKFQGFMMGILVIVLTIATMADPVNHVSRSEFALASNWTTEGLTAAVTLIIAISSAELFNQANWQRVWAAESIPSLHKGLCIGLIMVFLLMMFFGVMGMIAYANDPEAYNDGEKLAYLAFFDLLEPLNKGWQILTLILVTALSASTIDSLQNGLASLFSRDLVKLGWNTQVIARALVVAVNVPAIYLASKGQNVISLFLVADLACSTSVFPVFCGLQTEDRGILKAPTELGAFLGCISGVVAVLVNGVVNNASGGIFQYFWLQNGAICSLCGTKTLVSFIITPSVSLVMTYVVSYLDVMVRGERARQPLIPVAFDIDDETTDDVKEEEEQDDSKNEMVDEEEAEGLENESIDTPTRHDSSDEIFA